MKRFGPIFAIIALLALLGVLNQGLTHNAQKDNDEATPPKTDAKTPAPAAAPSTASDVKVSLPAEEIIGDPAKAKTRILVGWTFDETNQPAPQSLGEALQAVRGMAQKSKGAVAAVIVNLDVPEEELSPAARTVTKQGIQIVGARTSQMDGNPGSGSINAKMIQIALPHILGGS